MNAKMQKSKQGGISVAMLLLTMVISAVIGSYAYVSANNQRLTQHSIAYMEAKIIAENAVSLGAELFFKKLKNEPTIGPEALSKLLQKAKYEKFIKRVSVAQDKEDLGYSLEHVHFVNKKYGRTNFVSIVSMAKKGDVKVAFKTNYVVIEKDFLDYAIFTAGIFELAPYPKMDIFGKVRSNDIIRLGGGKGSNKLTFHDDLTTSSFIDIVKGWSKNIEKSSENIQVEYKKNEIEDFHSLYNGSFMPLDSDHPNWDTESLDHWQGAVQANVSKLEVPMNADDNHVLIEPVDSNDDDLLQREKLAWKAKNNSDGLTIKVDAGGNVRYQKGNSTTWTVAGASDIAINVAKTGSDGLYTIGNSKGWINVDPDFKDSRYTKRKISLVNIYMDRLIKKFPNQRIIYVEVEDKNGSTASFTGGSTDSLPAVRLRNGHDMSAASHGLTIATHRMTYIEGNYNATVNKISALVAADSVVALSNGWDDTNAGTSNPSGAESTSYQAAFMIGGYQYKDTSASSAINGIQNLVSFLEGWGDSGAVYNYLGSYVKMFSSKDTSASINGGVFRAPERNVKYDDTFVSSPPPGMPTALTTPRCVVWTEILWEDALALINP